MEDALKPTRVLVTGASGHVGRAVASRMQRAGCEVVGLGRSKHESAPWPTLTASGPEGLAACLQGSSFDVVVHAAAPGVKPGSRSWPELIEGCCRYTVEMVAAAAGSGASRFVNVGSWSEYAPPDRDGEEPLSEPHSIESANSYGAAKAAAFLMGQAEAAKVGIEFVSVRLFNVYGPGEAQSRLLPYVLGQLRAGQQVSLTPGAQERDFIFIDDVADAIKSMVEHPGRFRHSVYNVCTGQVCSVRSMVERVCRALGRDDALLQFGAKPYRSDEPLRVAGDPSRLRGEIGWRASIVPDEGVARFVEASAIT